MALSKSRLYTIIGIGVFVVLSVAIVLMAITVTRSNITTRSSNTEEMEEPESCQRVSTKTLKEALGTGEQRKLCDNKNLLLEVNYQGKALGCDQISTKQSTEKAPQIKLASAKKGAQYTMVMIDPDAPGHSLYNLTFWLHWAQTGLTGMGLQSGAIEGLELIEYNGPTPPSGTHRYMIVVFESTKQGKAQLYSAKKGDRSQFSLDTFVEKNRLCRIVGLYQFQVRAEK